VAHSCSVPALPTAAAAPLPLPPLTRNPRRSRNRGKQDAVNSTRAKFLHPDGDQLTLLAVMRAYLEVDRRQRAEWASDNFINIRCVWCGCGVCGCVGGGGQGAAAGYGRCDALCADVCMLFAT
jgi:hypothetical protein